MALAIGPCAAIEWSYEGAFRSENRTGAPVNTATVTDPRVATEYCAIYAARLNPVRLRVSEIVAALLVLSS